MTGQKFGQTPSSLLEIQDWLLARELDVAAAVYLHNEQVKREDEREQRDRDFWITMFGGEVSDGNPALVPKDFDVPKDFKMGIAREPIGYPVIPRKGTAW